MGLERMAQILQKVANNYETDLIFPIVAEARQLGSHRLPESGRKNEKFP
jgi:alanyl-tRNA synthetase